MSLKDETGNRYGRLVVIQRCGARINGTGVAATWLCKCDCGKYHVASGYELRRGTVSSCGCYRSDCMTIRNKIMWAEIHKIIESMEEK